MPFGPLTEAKKGRVRSGDADDPELKMTTVVVGAGIIGTAIAHDPQERGRQVVLLDRDAPVGASFGNMASIAVTEFMSASRASVWRRIPGWMLDPEGSVRVRPCIPTG